MRLHDAGPELLGADASVDGAPPLTDAAVPPDPPEDDGGPGATGVWLEVCNVSTNLNMRSGPTKAEPVIATVPLGASVRLLVVDGDWYQVDYQGTVGWCHSSYLCELLGADAGVPPPLDGGSPPTGSPGPFVGQLWNTYYYLAVEDDFDGAKDTVLYDSQCQPLATVSAKYSDTVCIEGSGKLSNGDLINYAKTCSCGRPCPTGGTICYEKLPPSFPWGAGAYNNPLVPLRSLAVDKNQLALGGTLYLKQLDGVSIPAAGGVAGFVHDGCFKADDVGGAIQGFHVDIFAGSAAMWQALEAILPTKSNIDAYQGGSRCAYLE